MNGDWYKLPIEKVLFALKSSKEGLSLDDAKQRLAAFGQNELEKSKRTNPITIFFRQFANPLVMVLIIALAVKLYTGNLVDSSVLGFTVCLMATISFFQEMKAEKAIEALKKLASHKSKVFRDGKMQILSSEYLVPGDVIYLEMGDKVPADGRLIDAKNLKIDESMFTGESFAREKSTDIISSECTIADRDNMVFAGTVVKYGKGLALITETGMQTEVGHIAKSLKNIDQEKTPLQKNIHSIGIKMIFIILAVLLLFGVISFYHGLTLQEIFFLGVSAAVSAIPESLPAAFTVAMATGMHKMAKKNAIIRKLIAVETLGSTTVICSDKTGTLTLNRMTVTKMASDQKIIPFESEYPQISKNSVFYKSLEAGAICSDAFLSSNGNQSDHIGDPTETAILEASLKIGIDKKLIEESIKRVKEIPFTSESLFMATLNQNKDNKIAYVKGAPEKILGLCGFIELEEGLKPLDAKILKKIEDNMHQMSTSALRLIASAYCRFDESLAFSEENLKGKLIFLGLLGLMDPPREEVKESIKICHDAGVKVIMITGDNPKTAASIASQIGIKSSGVITGVELKSMTDSELDEKIKTVSIFARIEPMQKLRIVQALKAHGQVIAMTGDGINDAPALEAANIGVAMGLKGTDVAKEVSDMVIADDHFDSIVVAIEEGRAIFNRLRNITAFLVTTCFGELFGLILNVLFIGKAPMTPVQILWINLVTGSIIAIPLGFEPKTGFEMKTAPRDPKSKLIYRGMVMRIAYMAFLLGMGSFFIFNHCHNDENIFHAKTMVLTSIVIFEWLIALHMRSIDLTFKKVGFFKNRWLIFSIIGAFSLHMMILYIPQLNPFFKTVPLSLKDWLVALTPGLFIFFAETVRKAFFPKIFSIGNGYEN